MKRPIGGGGLIGDVNKIRAIEKAFLRFPKVAARILTKRVASKITALGRATFNAGQNAYGDEWEPLADGSPATLVRSGALAKGVEYVANGRLLRARLGPRYAKYVIGKRPIFPQKKAKLPPSYNAAIRETLPSVIVDMLKGGV